jgi:hypothetical protein
MCTGKIENGYILKTWWKKTIKYTFIKCLSKLNYLVNRWRTEKLVNTHWTHKFFSVFTVNLFTCSRRKLITKTFLICSTQQFVVNSYSPNQHTFPFDWFENKHLDLWKTFAVDETRLQEKLSNFKFQALDAFKVNLAGFQQSANIVWKVTFG